MKCGHCGNEVANPESGYCPYCGRKLGKDAETPEKPSGNENTPSERYVVNDNGNKTDPKVKILIGALSATIIVLLGIIIIGRPKKSIAIASNDSISEKQEDAAETETVAEADQTDVQSNEGYVVFNDKALENEIRLSIGIFDREISTEEAKGISHLDLSGTDSKPGRIRNLDALAYFVNLEKINLSFNQIEDISGLSGLNNLETVRLESNQISDVSPLAGLTNLTLLDLASNFISDISMLSGLTQLEVFDVRDNAIYSISAVENMTKLKQLYIRDNGINDISSLANLVELNYLSIGENEIQDIWPLYQLKKLDHLVMCSNNISDIYVIRELPRLSYLEIQDNPIRDYSPLDELPDDCEVIR